MKHIFLDFMKSKQVKAKASVEVEVEVGLDMDLEAEVDGQRKIRMTEDGFPILPKDLLERDISKKECENILQEYLSQHYCKCELLCINCTWLAKDLASSKQLQAIPYGSLEWNVDAFVPEEYRPNPDKCLVKL